MADINQPYQNAQNNYNNFSFFSECINRIRDLTSIITFSIGSYLYILSFIDFYNSILEINIIYMNSIYASLLTLFCPLWTQSFSDISRDLKDCSRIKNIMILLLSLLCVLISNNRTSSKFGPLIFDFILILSGLCLALSYFTFGKAFIGNCNKACDECCRNCDDPCFCCPRYMIIDCDRDCGSCCDCGNCGDCGNCPDCGDCGDCDCIIM